MTGRKAVLFLLATVACSDSSGPGGPTFPTIPAAIVTQFCIRAQVVPPQTRSGSLATTDCQDGAGSPYYEIYRVRVASSTAVTFTMTSDFDSYLALVRIDDVNDPQGSDVLLAEDDDSAGNLDARLSFTLEPDTEYFIFVTSIDVSEVGNYSLAMTS